MADKYTIYSQKNGKWKVVETANPNKVMARDLTSAQARDKARDLNGKG